MGSVTPASLRMTPPIVWIMGGPGSGKGTQCEKIHVKYGHRHLSSGDLLRKEILADTERGKKIFSSMLSGNLVPDEIVVNLIEEAIASLPDVPGFTMDGFPATIQQANMFEEKIGKPAKIIVFEVSDDVMKFRLKERGNFDDKTDTVMKRISTYIEQTRPVVNKYYKNATVVRADQDMDSVFQDICKVLEE